MKLKKARSKEVVKSLIAVISFTLFLTLVSFTYAWFSVNLLGEGKVFDITTAKLGIIYTSGSDASLINAYPGDSVVKTFTVENVSDVETYYEIYWRDLINTFINDELVYSLTQERYERMIDETPIGNTEVIKSMIKIYPGEVHEYNLTITFKETGLNQNSNMGASLSGTIQIRENTVARLSVVEAKYNSIKVKAMVENVLSPVVGYEFSIDDGLTWEPYQTSDTYTFTNLEDATYYNIRVRVTNEMSAKTISNKLEAYTPLPPMKEIAGGPNTDGFLGISLDGYIYEWGNDTEYPKKVSSTLKAKAISIGKYHYLAIGEDGYLYSWGINDFGQLLTGNIISYDTPQKVTTFGKIKQITAGVDFSFVINETGEIYSSGHNDHGQLAIGIADSSPHPTPSKVTSINNIKILSCSWVNCITLLENGEVYVWGYGGHGSIGDGSYYNRYFPRKVNLSVIGTVKTVVAGNTNTGIVNTIGHLYLTGQNNYGQLGLGNKNNINSYTRVTAINNVNEVYLGDAFTSILRGNGEIWSWGNNSYGQLGLGNTTDSTLPKKSHTISNTKAITGGSTSLSILTNDNSIYTWGNNSNNQLGNGVFNYMNSPLKISIDGVDKVSSKSDSIVLKTISNDLYIWGKNDSGQLGKGDLLTQNIPLKLIDIGKVKDITNYLNNSAFIKEDNSLYTFGWNDGGALGIGTVSASPYPTPNRISVITSAKKVYYGALYGLSIDSNDDLYSWGWNEYGKLGQTSISNQSLPGKVSAIGKVKEAKAGYHSAMAIDINDDLWSWGYNGFGQLGNSSFDENNHQTPAKYNTNIKFKSIDSGTFSNIAVSTSGDVYIWGKSDFGNQSCNGTKCFTTLSKVEGLSNIKYASTNDLMYAAVSETGELYMWGKGRFGDGENEKNIILPKRNNDFGKVKQVELSSNNVYIITESNYLFSWGHNGYGQLGNGFITQSTMPIKIVGN